MFSLFTNPIALYNLGVHNYLGKGVNQNYQKAFDLFVKAGSANNYLYGCPNFGVKESSFAAAKCLEYGTGPVKDIEKAGEWYYESFRCDNGYGPAGIKYSELLTDNRISLIYFEPELMTQRIKDSTAAWGVAPDSFAVDFLLNFENPFPTIIHEPHGSNSKYWIHEKEIRLKAEAMKDGFCANLKNSMNEFAQGLYAMSNYFDANPNNSQREKVDVVQQEIIHHVANAFRCIEDVSICRVDNWQNFQKLIVENLNRPLDDMSTTSALDRDARICKLMEMKTCPKSTKNYTEEREKLLQFFKFLRQSKSKYPEELFFHRMSLSIASQNEINFGNIAGLDLEATLKTFPSHPDILYWRYVLIGNRSVDQLTKENAYLDFIQVAPNDHKYLPDALYRLAEFYGKSNRVEQCRTYYARGLSAEGNLLSFYLPYASEAKKKMISIQARGQPIMELLVYNVKN